MVDVGGGQGILLEAVLSRHEHLTGAVFDLPHVVAQRPTAQATPSVASRWSAVSGSFFDTVPAADCYLLKSVIHHGQPDVDPRGRRNTAPAVRRTLRHTRPTTTRAAEGEVAMADVETCSKCGAAVVDSYRHQRWHEKSDDDLSSLQRALRDLATSTKRSLEQFEAAVRRTQ